MKNTVVSFTLLLLIFSCKKDISVSFSETSITNEMGNIDIVIPKANESHKVASLINSKIENHIANMLTFSEDDIDNLTLKKAMSSFNKSYFEFKEETEPEDILWEAFFDGEVTYQSPEIISVVINSFLNTGGAHGNTNITFYNFDSKSGSVMELHDIIKDTLAFKTISKKHFEDETKTHENINFFWGDDFHLPANIGFNDEGVILFYNVYEIASYVDGITEFTIPFEEVEHLLRIH